MALDPATLATALEGVSSAPGASPAACAEAWAQAMGDYMATVVPASTAVEAAVGTLEEALAIAFAAPLAAAGMETAFTAFGGAVALGMPGLGFSAATPPAGLVGFAAQFGATPMPATHALAASTLAAKIHVWAVTGTAVPIPPAAAIVWT